MKCDNCKLETSRCRHVSQKGWFCLDCVYDQMQPMVYRTPDRVFLKGYGNVSVARLKEVDSRKILPYEKKDGGYYVGRKDRSGRIVSEKPPDYRP